MRCRFDTRCQIALGYAFGDIDRLDQRTRYDAGKPKCEQNAKYRKNTEYGNRYIARDGGFGLLPLEPGLRCRLPLLHHFLQNGKYLVGILLDFQAVDLGTALDVP